MAGLEGWVRARAWRAEQGRRLKKTGMRGKEGADGREYGRGHGGERGGGEVVGRIEHRRVKALRSKRKPGGREIAGLERKRREKKGLNYRLMPVSFLLTVIIKPRLA